MALHTITQPRFGPIPPIQPKPRPKPKPEPEKPPISQMELSLLLALRSRKRVLEAELREAEDCLRRRLEAGTAVEPGRHSASLVEAWRKSVGWKGVLIQFADGVGVNGEAYAAVVLANAQPKRTVNLVLA